MKRQIALLLAAVMTAGMLTACGEPEVGTIPMEQQQQTAPNLGNQQETQEAPQETTVAETEDANELELELYQDKYVSMYKPVGWEVYTKVYDDGTGKKRINITVTDPEDINNCIFLIGGIEPWFESDTEKNKMAKWLDNGSLLPVISPINATEALKTWPQLYDLWTKSGGVALDLTRHIGNYSVQEVYQEGTSDSSTDSVIISDVLAVATAAGSDKTYAVYFTNTFGKLYYAHLYCTYYASYGNVGFAGDLEKYGPYLSTLMSSAASFDLSGFNSLNSATAEETVLGDDPAVVMSNYKFDMDLSNIAK